MMAPEAFAPVPNAWGRQGWTTAILSKLSCGGTQKRNRYGLGACGSEETTPVIAARFP